MKQQTLLALLIFTFFSGKIVAQKYSNEFLSIGVGAREQGMSGATIATTHDVYSSYWNPAGLAQIESPIQIGAMHAEWFAGVAKYDFIGLAKPIGSDGKNVIGASVIRLGIDNIPYTLNLVGPDGSINYNNVTQFSSADYALQLNFARKHNENLSYGGSLKVIRRVIGTFASAWGVGIDVGVQYKSGDWIFAVTGRDITSTYNAWTATLTDDEKNTFAATGNTIPKSSVESTLPTIFLGVARKFAFGENFRLTTELDAGIATDGQRNVLVSSSAFSIDPRFGLELAYQKNIWLRAGVGNFQNIKNETDPSKKELNFQPNFGVGLRLGGLTIDYALTNIGNVSQVLYSNIFFRNLNFNSRKEGRDLKKI